VAVGLPARDGPGGRGVGSRRAGDRLDAAWTFYAVPARAADSEQHESSKVGKVASLGEARCIRRGVVLAVALVLVLLGLATPVQAATRSKLGEDEIRFTLRGKVLTVTIVDRENFIQDPSPQEELYGKRVEVGCGASFRKPREGFAWKRVKWPVGARSVTVHLGRDISRSAKWCLVEEGRGGGDIGFVSFFDAEPGRRLTSGRFADGRRWRIASWRGKQLEPCLAFRLPGDGYTMCFGDEAELEAALSATLLLPTCAAEGVVVGATARTARSATVILGDGTRMEAALYRRPRGSRVKAQYLVAILPAPFEVVAVETRDDDGKLIDRDGRLDALGRGDCHDGQGWPEMMSRP
jgi:hypothetical protein